jgi:hypothetical protein
MAPPPSKARRGDGDVEEEDELDHYECDKCRGCLAEDARFCPQCGTPTGLGEEEEEQGQEGSLLLPREVLEALGFEPSSLLPDYLSERRLPTRRGVGNCTRLARPTSRRS